jgi:CubicO group peptidase (beta-lactamase class C family)
MIRIPLLAGALSLLSAALSGQQSATTPAGWLAFTRLFDAYADTDKVVGASVFVMRDGRVVCRHDYGLADRATGERVDDRTIFHYGSITKTLTAIAIMQLRDRGRLSLDDHIVRWVPELRLVHDPYGMIDSITLRMLLSHSAGFQNPTWPYTEGRPWEPFEPTTWAQLVAMMPYQELHFKPGTRYSYSNPGFIYLARVIEQLSGDPWEVYVQKNIFAPLGLTRSYFGATPYYLAADRSNNYTIRRDSSRGEVMVTNGRDFDPGITIPNGGWNAPLADLATYTAFLMNATHGDSTLRARYDVVLSRKSLEEMWQPVIQTNPAAPAARSSSAGLSFFTERRDGVTFIGHTGSQAGFLAFMYLNPASSMAVVAAFNTNNQSRDGARSGFSATMEAALRMIR